MFSNFTIKLLVDLNSRLIKYIHPSTGSGIIASFCNLNEMTDPEFVPVYYSKSGTITITQIDTGTYLKEHAVLINLEATFNFNTD